MIATNRLRLLIFLLFLWTPLSAATAQDIDPAGPWLEAQAERAEDGHIILLKDGRRLLLSGLWPLRRLHNGGDVTEDGLAIMAQARLSTLNRIRFFLTSQKPDRYGRLKAHILTDQNRWLSRLLLEEGLAYAFPLDESQNNATALYAAEDKARQKRKGLWAHPSLSAQQADMIKSPAGQFAVITGRVKKATKVGGTVYLNFGTDWRQDFTIRLNWPLRRQYPKSERDEKTWQGQQLEVRGVLEDFNGPLITPLHPSQIRRHSISGTQ